jgi:hypothetical protein
MLTPTTEKQLVELIDKAIKNFSGNSDSLAGAIGYLLIGRKFGWRVMFFMHSQATVRKYEKILGVSSRDAMPEEGPMAKKAYAFQAMKKVSNFLKGVKGEIAGIKSKEVLR